MADDEWVVLREHTMNPSLLSIDGSAVVLLALEAELHESGIETGFDPYRPGEAPSWSRSLAQPVRLLVQESDLVRAREVAAALEAELEAAPELDSDDSEFEEDDLR